MLSLINWYSSQTNRATNQTKAKCDGWGNEMCCKNSNKAVAWSMFRSVSYGVSFPQTIQAVQVDGAQLWWGLSSPMDKERPFWSGFMQVVRVEQHGGVVSFHYLPITDMNPTGLNCIYSTLWFTRMYILVKLVGFHTIMNGLDATGYIMAGFGFRRASEGNLCDKHYSTHQVWPVTTVHSGPAFSSLQPSTTSLPQPPAHWFSHLRQRKEILLICTKARWLKITTWRMKIWAVNPGNVPLRWPFNRTHPSLAAIKYKWFMSCMTKFPHMRITHIITAKLWLQFKELIGININFSESRVSFRFQYH